MMDVVVAPSVAGPDSSRNRDSAPRHRAGAADVSAIVFRRVYRFF